MLHDNPRLDQRYCRIRDGMRPGIAHVPHNDASPSVVAHQRGLTGLCFPPVAR